MPTASGSLAFLGAARFQGYWNANSNNAEGSGLDGAPSGEIVGLFLAGTSTTNGGYAHAHNTLTASAGDYWQVTGSGTHNVDGITNWNLNDWCIYSGSAGGTGDWIKLAFEDTIASIVLGDLSSSSFHLSAENDKHIIFASGSVHSGSDNFTFNYDTNQLHLTATLEVANGDGGNNNVANLRLITNRSGQFSDSRINFKKSAGSVGSPSTVSEDDQLGQISWWGYNSDGALYDQAAHIFAAVDGEPSTGADVSDMPGRIEFATTPDGEASPVSRMVIKSDGKIGIGTTAPLDTLSVTGTLAVSAATSFRDDVNIADDKKVIFGDANEAHIEYNENGDDFLVISGSHGGGTVISGSKLAFDSSTVASGTIAGPGSYLAVKSTGQVVLTSSAGGGGAVSAVANGVNNRIATFSSADALNGESAFTFDGSDVRLTGNFNFDGGVRSINFSPSSSPAFIKYNAGGGGAEYLIISGSESGGTVISGSRIVLSPRQQDYGVLFETGDVVISDNIKLAFGGARDGHIEYDENGTDFLIISGSGGTKGLALSGSNVVIHPRLDIDLKADRSIDLTAANDIDLNGTGTNSNISIDAGSNGSVTLLTDGQQRAQFHNAVTSLGLNGKPLIIYTGVAALTASLVVTGSSGQAWLGYPLSQLSALSGVDGATILNVSGSTKLGNLSSHLHQVTGSLRLTDDAKLEFGSAGEGHIEYNENGDDNLIISGSSSGMVLSGTIVQVSGNMVVKFPNYLAVTSNDSHNASSFYVQTGQGAQFHGGVDSGGVTIRDAGDVHIADDKKIIFGTGEEAHIEYNENDDDFLVISGSSEGVVLSGSVIALDGNTNVAGTFVADAGASGTHILTGSLEITGSDGVSLQLKSTGSVSLRLEADTDNSEESQNPFIELVQDGGFTDFTIGLTEGGKNPEGVTIDSMTDNSLAIGSNTDSTNATHIQFYHRNSASFSLLDKGSTNHIGVNGPVDLQGFRVGVGPDFNDGNFPKGRMEIYNTSLSPVPALYLTVSGTSQQALVVDTKNTTKNVVEISGSSLTTGDLMHLYSNSSNTSDRSLLKVTNDNASSEKVTLIELKQDAFSYPAFIQRGGGTVKNLPTFSTSHATSQTIAITHLIEGSYFAVGRGAGTTDTTPSAAQIVARIKDAAVGDSFDFAYFNAGTVHDVTLAGGADVQTLDGSAASFSITAGKGRMFAFVLMDVGSGTEQVDMIPKSDLFNINS